MNKPYKFTSGSAIRDDETTKGQVFGHLALANNIIKNFKIDFTLYHDRRKPFTICTIETIDLLKLSKAELLEQVQNEHLIQRDVTKAFSAWKQGKKSRLSGIMTLGWAGSLK